MRLETVFSVDDKYNDINNEEKLAHIIVDCGCPQSLMGKVEWKALLNLLLPHQLSLIKVLPC